jgi:hypothetical protein
MNVFCFRKSITMKVRRTSLLYLAISYCLAWFNEDEYIFWNKNISALRLHKAKGLTVLQAVGKCVMFCPSPVYYNLCSGQQPKTGLKECHRRELCIKLASE